MSEIGTDSYNFQETIGKVLQRNCSGKIQHKVCTEMNHCHEATAIISWKQDK